MIVYVVIKAQEYEPPTKQARKITHSIEPVAQAKGKSARAKTTGGETDQTVVKRSTRSNVRDEEASATRSTRHSSVAKAK